MAKNDTARMVAKIKKQNGEIKRLKNELKAYIEGSVQLSRALDRGEVLTNGDIMDISSALMARSRMDMQNKNAVTKADTAESGKQYSVHLTTDGRKFVKIDNDILAGVPEQQWVTMVKQHLKTKFPDGITVGNNQIVIDKQSRQEMTYSQYMQYLKKNDPQIWGDKLRAADNADEIIENATDWTNEGLKHPRKDKIKDFARGRILLRIGNNDYSADVVVGTEKNGKMKLYDFLNMQTTQFTEKEAGTAVAANPSPGADRNTVSPSTPIITDVDGNSNSEISQNRAEIDEDGAGTDFEGADEETYADEEYDEEAEHAQKPEYLKTVNEWEADINAASILREGKEHGMSVRDIKRLQSLSRLLHRQIRLYTNEAEGADTGGFFDHDTGAIYINAKCEDPVMQTLSHELTHSLEGTSYYNQLAEYVRNNMPWIAKVRYEDKKAEIEAAYEAAKEKGVIYSDRVDGDHETVAWFVEHYLLKNEKQIRRLCDTKPTLGRRILNWFDRLLEAMGNKKAINRQQIQTMRNLYKKALDEQSGRGDNTITAREHLESAREGMETGRVTDEQFDAAYDEYATLDLDRNLDVDIEPSGKSFKISESKNVKEFLRKFTGEIDTDGWPIHFTELGNIRHNIKSRDGHIEPDGKSGQVFTAAYCYDFGITEDYGIIIRDILRHEDLEIRKDETDAEYIGTGENEYKKIGEAAERSGNTEGRRSGSIYQSEISGRDGRDDTVAGGKQDGNGRGDIGESQSHTEKEAETEGTSREYRVSRSAQAQSDVLSQVRKFLAGNISKSELQSFVDGVDGGNPSVKADGFATSPDRGGKETSSERRSTPQSLRDRRNEDTSSVSSADTFSSKEKALGRLSSEARDIVLAAREAGMSVDEYLRGNAELYEVDGEYSEAAREALDAERGGIRREYKVGGYWKPNLTNAEWTLMEKTLDRELESKEKVIDEATKWLYANEKGYAVFAIYGIGDGSEGTILYAISGARAVDYGRSIQQNENDFNKFIEEAHESGEEDRIRRSLAKIVSAIRRKQGQSNGGVLQNGNRGGAVANVRVSSGKRGSNRGGNNGQSGGNIQNAPVKNGPSYKLSDTTSGISSMPTKVQNHIAKAENGVAKELANGLSIKTREGYGQVKEILHTLSEEYMENGAVADESLNDAFEKLFDLGDTIKDDSYKAWVKNDFIVAVNDMITKLTAAKRFENSRNEEIAAAAEIPQTTEELFDVWEKFRVANRAYDRVMSKHLFTEEDKLLIGRLLRGETDISALDNITDNADAIREAFEARREYEEQAKVLKAYRRHHKAQLRAMADSMLTTALAWRDKGMGIKYERETMERNIRDIVPDRALANKIIATYITPIHHAEAESNRAKNRIRARVKALDLDSKPLSKKDIENGRVSEAYAVQFIGEARDNIRRIQESRGRLKQIDGKTETDWKAAMDALWANNPDLDREKIDNAIEEFRKIYDELFTAMNEVRVRSGYEPIPYRKGYFPHFQLEGEGGIMSLFGQVFGISTDVLPTSINGMTHTFKPGISYFAHAQERLGFATVFDAVEGLDRYLEGAMNVIYHTDNIQRLRALASQIRYNSTSDGIRGQVDKVLADKTLTEQDKENRIRDIYEKGRCTLSNFAAHLDEYTNLLAGKKSLSDRTMEYGVGRTAYNTVSKFSGRVAANMISANIGSALTNFIPIVQASAAVPTGDVLKGMYQTLGNIKDRDGIAEQSDFIANRRGSHILKQTGTEKAGEIAMLLMECIDSFVSESIVRARYSFNLKRGMSEQAAMEEADAFAAGVIADRSRGAMPTLFYQKNPMAKTLTQFQLEVNNQYSYMFKDLPREVKERGGKIVAGMLLKFLLGSFLYNELYELVVGRRPAFDVLGILNDTAGDFTGYELPNVFKMGYDALLGDGVSGEDFKTDKKKAGGALAALGENVVEELPFTGALSLVGIAIGGTFENFSSAVKQMFSDEAIPKSAMQYAYDYLYYESGAFGRILLSILENGANELPAYIVSFIAGLLNPVAGAVAGIATSAATDAMMQNYETMQNGGTAFDGFNNAMLTIPGSIAIGSIDELLPSVTDAISSKWGAENTGWLKSLALIGVKAVDEVTEQKINEILVSLYNQSVGIDKMDEYKFRQISYAKMKEIMSLLKNDKTFQQNKYAGFPVLDQKMLESYEKAYKNGQFTYNTFIIALANLEAKLGRKPNEYIDYMKLIGVI